MTFWAYMLHCRGGYFYVGHTDDLDRRIAQHEHGSVAGFVGDHWPAKLVWSQEFTSRIEALEAERRIKGWSRAKKMALICGDWNEIARLAKNKGKASTSSARTGEGALLCHSSTPTRSFRLVGAHYSDGHLRFTVANADALRLPEPSAPTRTDGLWQTTCFELFVKPATGDGYLEFNFSPSTQWAAYAFDSYRSGMRELPVTTPPVIAHDENGWTITLPAEAMPAGPLAIALSAVIEELDGTKSYWALRHPPGKPDFHHPDCFALTLP